MEQSLLERGVFKVAEASAYLRVNQTEVRRMLQVGELKGWRTLVTRGDWRVSRAACDEWIAMRENGALKAAAK